MKRLLTTADRGSEESVRASASLPGNADRRSPDQQRRGLIARVIKALPPGLSVEEVKAHCDCMPVRYWTELSESDLRWHLFAVHGFFEKLARYSSLGTPVWVDWVDNPTVGESRVVVCSWDRRGLLEQIAAAFGALRCAIRQADVYTRTDSLAIDVFQVIPPDGVAGLPSECATKLAFLVEGAYTHPPRFASVWTTEFHKVLPRRRGLPPQVRFDNRSSRDHTVLTVTAPDRMGLLYDLLHALGAHRLQIAQAVISTERGRVKDQFHLTDADGKKITDSSHLKHLRADLKDAIES
jgi:UTP:GlnB (protein PII) uridylyltransferase